MLCGCTKIRWKPEKEIILSFGKRESVYFEQKLTRKESNKHSRLKQQHRKK